MPSGSTRLSVMSFFWNRPSGRETMIHWNWLSVQNRFFVIQSNVKPFLLRVNDLQRLDTVLFLQSIFNFLKLSVFTKSSIVVFFVFFARLLFLKIFSHRHHKVCKLCSKITFPNFHISILYTVLNYNFIYTYSLMYHIYENHDGQTTRTFNQTLYP